MSGRYTELSYRDDRIGDWKTTIRNDKPGWCLWEAQRLLEAQQRETYFALSGSVLGPDPGLLEQVYRVLSNLGAISEIVDKELRKCSDASVAEFFVAEIGDWEQVDETLQIDFAPIGRRALEDDKVVFWSAENPDREHRIVIRTNDVRIAPGQLVERGLV